MSLVMSPAEREAFLAETHVAIVSIAEAGRGPLAIPVWYRTEAEWRRPFTTGSSHTRLELEHCEVVRLGDPLWEQSRGEDPSAYARAVAAALRVSFGPSLLASVPATERADLSRRLFDEVRKCHAR